MQKNILLVQSRRRPDMLAIEQQEFTIAAGDGAKLTFISALDTTAPWSEPEKIVAGYDAVILGGSGEFDIDGGRDPEDEGQRIALEILARLTPLMAFLVTNDKPTLGVCFGHQLIGEFQGGSVVSDPLQKKVGSHTVRTTEEASTDVLFAQMPQVFVAQYGHKDSLSTLPRGATLLGIGDQCRFSALRYGQHVYTVQFHPEMTAQNVFARLEKSPGYLPEGVDVKNIVQESPEASTLIARFIALV